MPKVTLCSRDKPMNDALLAEIARGMAVKGKHPKDIALYTGVSKGTALNRRNKPETFQLGELRKLFNVMGTSNEVILAVFGRKEDKG